MSASWLSDIAYIVMGQSPPGDTCNRSGYGIPLLNGPTEFGPHHPAPVQFTTDPKKLALEGDLLFCVRGSTTGRMNWADQDYAIGRGVAAIRHRSNLRLQPLVRGLIEQQLPTLLQSATGSTFPNVSAKQLGDLQVPKLSDDQLFRVAELLAALDNKIELNRRMNETLEAMAQAIFKDWFVDFGPTRAKAEGRVAYLDCELWDLFPDDLDGNDKPIGWCNRSIYEFAAVIYGAPFSSRQFNSEKEGIPLIRIRDLATHDPGVSTVQIHNKGHMIEPGDIIVGMDGEFRLHIWKGPKAWLNQRVCHFEPKVGIPKAYLAEALKEPLAFFERGKVGTTVIHLGKSDIDTFELIFPGERVFKAFARVAEPLVEATVSNALQARVLVGLRDLLLPRLMSGKVDLTEAKRAVETAA